MTTIRPIKINETGNVLSLWQQACVEAVGEQLSESNTKQVMKNLKAYAVHEICHCFVAVEDEQIIGFVTLSMLKHPIEPGSVGEVEELYVQPIPNKIDVMKSLVSQAVMQLKQQGVGVITTRVDVDEPDRLSFWNTLKWSQDTVNFTIYDNLPSDPDLQAVWDNYIP